MTARYYWHISVQRKIFGLAASLPRAALAICVALSCLTGVVTASEQKPDSSHLRTADAWLTEHAAPVTVVSQPS
jgi:hypothetical protein